MSSARSLEGLRVLDLTHGGFAYGGYLFAGHAADVTSLGCARDRTYSTWETLGPSAEERAADLERAEVRAEIARQLGSADVVLESFAPGALERHGLGWEDVAAKHPRLVWASMTSFGRSGPRREWKSTNLLAWAISGLLPSIGDPDRAPLAPGGQIPLADLLTALHTAIGVQIALRARKTTGRGQLVDVSTQATAVAASCELGAAMFLDDLIARRRIGNRRRQLAPSGLYECKDGFAAVIILPPAHWDAMAKWIHEKTGNETVLDPMWRDLATRVETAELLESWIEELTPHYTKQELFEQGQKRGITITPANTLTTLLADPHLAARGWWRTGKNEEGKPEKVAGPPYRLRGDEHRS
ncbi:MAG: CaiB/BaiF CoA transferase family protein [Candidatus Binatia bacterium]